MCPNQLAAHPSSKLPSFPSLLATKHFTLRAQSDPKLPRFLLADIERPRGADHSLKPLRHLAVIDGANEAGMRAYGLPE